MEPESETSGEIKEAERRLWDAIGRLNRTPTSEELQDLWPIRGEDPTLDRAVALNRFVMQARVDKVHAMEDLRRLGGRSAFEAQMAIEGDQKEIAECRRRIEKYGGVPY